MVVNSRTNVANAILSAITLACGVIFSVLIALVIQRAIEVSGLGTSSSSAYVAYAGSPVWSIGFGYMIPGLIGVIASIARQKGGFIAQMVFCILSLLCMGIFFIIGILALIAASAFGSSTGCYTVGNTCSCLSSYSISLGYTCDYVNSITSMAYGAVSMMVLGWIFTLAACITGGILGCSNDSQPGVIIHHQPQPTVAVMQMGHMGQPQGGYVAQPGYGGHQGYTGPHGYVPPSGYPGQPYNPPDTKRYY